MPPAFRKQKIHRPSRPAVSRIFASPDREHKPRGFQLPSLFLRRVARNAQSLGYFRCIRASGLNRAQSPLCQRLGLEFRNASDLLPDQVETSAASVPGPSPCYPVSTSPARSAGALELLGWFWSAHPRAGYEHSVLFYDLKRLVARFRYLHSSRPRCNDAAKTRLSRMAHGIPVDQESRPSEHLVSRIWGQWQYVGPMWPTREVCGAPNAVKALRDGSDVVRVLERGIVLPIPMP